MTENFEDKDLLGDPVKEPEETRGRKSFEVTEEKRIKVKLLRRKGRDNFFIAAAIGCCEKTLRTYFFHELEFGAAEMEAQIQYWFYEKAKGGSVPAMKALEAGGEDSTVPERLRDEDLLEANTKPKKLGKKEEAELAAQRATQGGKWGELIN